ncbi:NUDIX hydrolase [Maridesulfovibrio sp.]|uniref:NUDIX hydrolase n=1 Tax=Maridesulfovibrio sp. TaxID=2795000 RepID=UPI003BAD700B
MSNEKIEIFDDNFNYLGIESSHKAHRNGLWHKVVHCWLVDTKTQKILYQRRSDNKKLYPGMLDVSVAGHCDPGESYSETAKRECFEEIGIDIDTKSIVSLGLRRDCFLSDDIVNREFQKIIIVELDIDFSKLKIEPNEVAEVGLIAPDDILSTYNSNITFDAVFYNGEETYSKSISAESIIQSIDNYNYKVPKLIKKYLSGDELLFV